MNRFYKVIWNKTRGMYMVVSELAKSHSKSKGSSSSAQRKGAQVLMAMMLAVGLSMTPALVQPLPMAYAATGDIVGEVDRGNSDGKSIPQFGSYNVAPGNYATVTGGLNNEATGNHATVTGGTLNEATNTYSTVSGGTSNKASGHASAVFGGYQNNASGSNAISVGGYKGSASGQYSTAIGGGSAQGDYSISIGQNSVATGEGQISFGDASDTSKNHQLKNIADGTDDHDAVALGQVYTKTQTDAQIAAAKPIVGSVNTGGNSTATGWYSTVTGGSSNTASGQQSSVAGGYYNTAGNRYTFAAGGQNNTAGGQESVVIGGSRNQAGIWEPGTPAYDASGSHSLVAGGQENLAEGSFSVILGGENNYTGGGFSAVVGGANNTTTHMNTVALGGQNSNILGAYSASLGGRGSTVAGHWSVGIGGGSIGENVYDAVAVGRSSVVTVQNGLALGNGATTDEVDTIAFGHNAGDISGYTVTWQQDSNGSPDYSESPTITENTYSEAKYNRLVKVADGVDDHDVATMGQLNTKASVSDLNDLKTTVADNTAAINTNTTAINEETAARKAAVTSLENSIAQHLQETYSKTDADDKFATKTDLSGKADVTALNQEITNRTSAESALQTQIDNKADLSNVYTRSDAEATFAQKSDLTAKANVDDVYTKTVADNTFATKADVNAKANASDVYTKTDADAAFASKTEVDNHEGRITSLESLVQQTGQAATLDAIEKANEAAETANQSAKDAHAAAQEATTIANNVQGQVTTLDNKIDAETTARQNADSDLQNQINQKANAADVYTKAQVDSEFARQSEVNQKATQTALNQEVTDRASADRDLQAQIDKKADAANVYTQQAADDKFATKTALEDKANQTDLETEIAQRTSDVNSLQSQLSAKADTSALTIEQSQREAADNQLKAAQDNLLTTVNNHASTLNTHQSEIDSINQTLTTIDADNIASKANEAQAAATRAQTAANEAHGVARSMQDSVNHTLKVDTDYETGTELVLQSQTVSSSGEILRKDNVTSMTINPAADNQVTIDTNGITVGTNSTHMDEHGFYAGRMDTTQEHTYANALAGINDQGEIKGASGNFTVDTAGKVTAQGMDVNNNKITNVAAGTEATDAVNYGQLAQTNERVGNAERRISNLEGRVDKVGASAAAMANLHPMEFDEDTKISVAGAVGNYGSATAAAVGVFYRPTERVMFNVSSSFGNGETMVGGGVSFALGRSSKSDEKKLTDAERTNLQQQVNTLKAQNEAQAKKVDELQAKLDALLSVLDADTVQKAQAALNNEA